MVNEALNGERKVSMELQVRINCAQRGEPPFHTAMLVFTTGTIVTRDHRGTFSEFRKTRDSEMFFLLRLAFWLTVILALLPVFVTHDNVQSNAASRFSAGDAVSAATAAVSDLSQFCSRRPEACEAGMQAAVAVGASAQTGVKILYSYFQSKAAADAEPAMSRNAVTNPRKSAQAKPAGKDAQDTLSTSDLAPVWRVPARNSGA